MADKLTIPVIDDIITQSFYLKITDKLYSIEQSINTLKESIENNTLDIDAADLDDSEYIQMLPKMYKDISANSSDISTLKNSVDANETEINIIQESITELKASIPDTTAIETRLSSIEANLETMQTTIDDILARLEVLENTNKS